jgi:hypothetical protein
MKTTYPDEESIMDFLSNIKGYLNGHTLQLYRYYVRDYCKPIGTAVLLKFNSNFYLISASHLFAENPLSEIVYFDKQNNPNTIGGELIYTKNSESKINDQVDIAIVKIDDITKSIILDLNHVFFDFGVESLINVYPEESLFYVFGFPVNKTKTNKKTKKIKATPYSLITGLSDNKMPEYHEDYHLQLRFTRNKMSRLGLKQPVKAPSPIGLSGCGVWYLPTVLNNKVTSMNYLLAGILTEYISDRSIIIITRTSVILNILQTQFKKE